MGWKPGSGLGPKVTPQRRSWLLDLFSTRRSSSPGGVPDADAKGLTLPPDTPMPLSEGMKAKTDTSGLGWTSDRRADSSESITVATTPQEDDIRKRLILGSDVDSNGLTGIYDEDETLKDVLERRKKQRVTDVARGVILALLVSGTAFPPDPGRQIIIGSHGIDTSHLYQGAHLPFLHTHTTSPVDGHTYMSHGVGFGPGSHGGPRPALPPRRQHLSNRPPPAPMCTGADTMAAVRRRRRHRRSLGKLVVLDGQPGGPRAVSGEQGSVLPTRLHADKHLP